MKVFSNQYSVISRGKPVVRPQDKDRFLAPARARSFYCSLFTVYCLLLSLLLVFAASHVHSDVIWCHDNTRVWGFVRNLTEDGKLCVQLPEGGEKLIPLENVITVTFRGRIPTLIQSGTQEFRFIAGGYVRGEIIRNEKDTIQVKSHAAGEMNIGMDTIKGFVALPQEGFTGRKAHEAIEREHIDFSTNLDWVLDRRGSEYLGTIRGFEKTALYIDHDERIKNVQLPIHRIAGVRLAESARKPALSRNNGVHVHVLTRDGSSFSGDLKKIKNGIWSITPNWDASSLLSVDFNEMVQVQVIGGRVQYLSHLKPVSVKETTLLTPPQSYRMNSSCQGEMISIAGRSFPWGVGVHADSSLTFSLGKKFSMFIADAGIATRMGLSGSVVFRVLGDGKELYKSPVVRGSDPAPHPISVPVKGVDLLTLEVTDSGDLDLGDVANWGSARVIR